MVKVVAVYVLAIIIVAAIGNIGLLLLLVIRPMLVKVIHIKAVAWLTIYTGAGLCICSNTLAVFIIVWLASKLTIRPSLAMLILPSVLTVSHNFSRIRQVKRGRIKRILEGREEQYTQYDHSFAIRNEYADSIGDILGLALGAILFMRNSPFI